MKNGSRDRHAEERSAELAHVLPFPFRELFASEASAPLKDPASIRSDVFEVLLTQTEALAWTWYWALLTEEGKDQADGVTGSLLILAEYLRATQIIYGFTKEP
jgi:hypothetical protein